MLRGVALSETLDDLDLAAKLPDMLCIATADRLSRYSPVTASAMAALKKAATVTSTRQLCCTEEVDRSSALCHVAVKSLIVFLSISVKSTAATDSPLGSLCRCTMSLSSFGWEEDDDVREHKHVVFQGE
jgi:hypothetical protein